MEIDIELQKPKIEMDLQLANQRIPISNYNALDNKPQINGIELIGNKTSKDLGIVNEETLKEYATQKYVRDSIDSAIGDIEEALDKIENKTY